MKAILFIKLLTFTISFEMYHLTSKQNFFPFTMSSMALSSRDFIWSRSSSCWRFNSTAKSSVSTLSQSETCLILKDYWFRGIWSIFMSQSTDRKYIEQLSNKSSLKHVPMLIFINGNFAKTPLGNYESWFGKTLVFFSKICRQWIFL